MKRSVKMARAMFVACVFFCQDCQNVSAEGAKWFGMEVEEGEMSEERLSCLCAEQEKPEPVEMMVLVQGVYLKSEKHYRDEFSIKNS